MNKRHLKKQSQSVMNELPDRFERVRLKKQSQFAGVVKWR